MTVTESRLFITAGAEHWQLFSFAQNKNDSSIYVGAPSFNEIKWLALDEAPGRERRLITLDSPGDGKLSLHGSGLVHVREHGGMSVSGLVFRGNALKGVDTLGVRHMFTVLISEPEHLPVSPAFNRKSDQAIQTQTLLPFVFVFWAVPGTRKLTVEVSASFSAEDLESIPPHTGWGGFGLATHWVVWFAYRTRHMQRWPRHPHASFHDGHSVPMLIGISEGGCRLELRSPQYSLEGEALSVRL